MWQQKTGLFSIGKILSHIALSMTALGFAGAAQAYYIGPSYLKLEGLSGGAQVAPFENWFRLEANYWQKRPELREIRGITGNYSGLKYTGSRAPETGPDMLAVAISKDSPGLAALMTACQNGGVIPSVSFAEVADLARHPQERGPRPADIPEYYQYRLHNVQLACPIVEAAPEQALTLQFERIEWLNSQPQAHPRELNVRPASLIQRPAGGDSKVFVISWFAPISDSSDDQCPVMNSKPSQDDYYALMSPERAQEQRQLLAEAGGANTRVMPYRGPAELNVTMLPGIVPDPGHVAPKMDIVRGFNLDGHDGNGPYPDGIKAHKNYTSPDGEQGIDNQLFAIQGCIEGWRKNGFLPMIGNELRRAGGLSILVEISGIDDMMNDDEVAVTILYSTDPMRRDSASKEILSDFTFRVDGDPEYSQDFARFRGRIVNGEIITEPLDMVHMHEGKSGSTWSLAEARMKLKIKEDGSLEGLLGGYRDIYHYLAMAFFRSSDYEATIGFNSAGLYNAVKRAADGLQHPVTGDFEGISSAYELIGIPAFIPESQQSLEFAKAGR